MRHFKLVLFVLMACVIAASVTAAVLAVHERYAPAILVAMLVPVLCAVMWHKIEKLKLMVWTFAKALEENDTSTAFDTATDDETLRETLEAFNHCITRYHSAIMEVETGKLYYDRILRVMSHEMGNAITPVTALCADMRKHPERYSGERLAEAVELIDGRSRGVKRFLKAYYRLTHIPEPVAVSTDAREFMQRVSNLVDFELDIRGLAREVCEFKTSGVRYLEIDTGLMEQVMVNLVRNALDAVEGVDEPRVSVMLSANDNAPYILIEDNGCGIDAAVRDCLFQPFVTTKPEGTGVGLYLSRQIVRRHGGDLRLWSAPGKGARAVIEFKAVKR